MAKKPVIINCGGEGECPGAINVNVPNILDDKWRVSRDGTQTLQDVKKNGPVVIARGDCLPFASACADEVQANNVPVGDHKTWLGPAYSPNEMNRISKR